MIEDKHIEKTIRKIKNNTQNFYSNLKKINNVTIITVN